MADIKPQAAKMNGAVDSGLASPDSLSKGEYFVSAPSTPLDTQGSTPATTLSTQPSEQEKPVETAKVEQAAPIEPTKAEQAVPVEAAKPVEQEKPAEPWHLPKNAPLKTVIPVLLPGSSVKPTPALTTEQQAKYDSILATVSTWTTIPATTARNAPAEPIEEHERMWLTKECLLRYLRATKWNTAHAIKRLQSTLSWRREYGADKFTADYISPENETGKQAIVGYDNDGRTCWYMDPGRQNTKTSERQIHQVSYMLDRAVDLLPPGQEKLAILISFGSASRGSTPSVGMGRQALSVLQTHNPERLGRALIINMPWFISGFFKLISPFIDPLTKEKIRFDEDLKKFVPAENLLDRYGGELNFEYDHSVYWPSLTEEARKRREAYRQRWEAGGKMIGENEAYLRGGDCKPIKEERAQQGHPEDGKIVEALTDQAGNLKV